MTATDCRVVARVGRSGLEHVRTEGLVSGRITKRYATSVVFPAGDGPPCQAWVAEHGENVWPNSGVAVVFWTWPTGRVTTVSVRPAVSLDHALDMIANTAPFDEGSVDLFDADGDPFLSFSAYPLDP